VTRHAIQWRAWGERECQAGLRAVARGIAGLLRGGAGLWWSGHPEG
jgi:hypothetical protein